MEFRRPVSWLIFVGYQVSDLLLHHYCIFWFAQMFFELRPTSTLIFWINFKWWFSILIRIFENQSLSFRTIIGHSRLSSDVCVVKHVDTNFVWKIFSSNIFISLSCEFLIFIFSPKKSSLSRTKHCVLNDSHILSFSTFTPIFYWRFPPTPSPVDLINPVKGNIWFLFALPPFLFLFSSLCSPHFESLGHVPHNIYLMCVTRLHAPKKHTYMHTFVCVFVYTHVSVCIFVLSALFSSKQGTKTLRREPYRREKSA